jgi:branched-chain amino acid transport system ATP-binding protein
VTTGMGVNGASRASTRDDPPALEVQGLDVGYDQSTVLRGVSVVVPKGSVVALLGPNGSGKSTLLRTVSGFLRPSRGTIAFDGVDITNARPA